MHDPRTATNTNGAPPSAVDDTEGHRAVVFQAHDDATAPKADDTEDDTEGHGHGVFQAHADPTAPKADDTDGHRAFL
ncbi:hypothetical protein [Jatrophihabitans sp.]|uniref:hypothetical protein n=1 Tax=Jatrophihabitans sp. TaxID=1932789 RepID=UPI0030C69BF7|nr:hypothetical protein [Jatrophihabitans sp.]